MEAFKDFAFGVFFLAFAGSAVAAVVRMWFDLREVLAIRRKEAENEARSNELSEATIRFRERELDLREREFELERDEGDSRF
jgi:hypothetical protein